MKLTEIQATLATSIPTIDSPSTTEYLPDYKELPVEFRRYPPTKWNELFAHWFYKGMPNITPKDGVDFDEAVVFICAHMRSFAPKHEHKESGVAWLMSQLFEDWSA